MQSVWVPDPSDVFVQGQLIDEKTVRNKQNKEESVGIVKLRGEEVEFPMKDVSPVNPSTFDKIDDMSELTFLNEASVLYNLENRYNDDMIYTYSGLFLVAINPYSNIRIYTPDYIKLYHGSPKEDNGPHIFAIAEEAYQNLLTQKRDQSILVTGESGAGKTENTKKILQYLASITADDKTITSQAHESFERKILQSNPILESFGNAQTVRNNNSSRFGKFIKIEFDEMGKINGAHIEWYLLEKSRVIHQNSRERNYHIFYEMLSGMSSQELKRFGLESNSVSNYAYLRESNFSIPGIDDAKDFQGLLSAFKTVGFDTEEVNSILQCVAIILHIGNVEFVSEKAAQAAIKGSIESLCKLLGVDEEEFKTAILRPKSKAGKEWVFQSKNATQSRFILNSLSRSLYENLFAHIVKKINSSLDHGSMTENYIGLLDIAGFEIFKDNSFEQLCINYTNEKLQQFFNHHMFVLEQNEYLKENIQWNFIDYGKDLQTTIDLIEKKNNMPGVLSLLDEESILPNSTDESFYSKLMNFCDNTSPKFKRSKLNNCFILKHYAGDVEYNVNGWLSKNKDPLSENILQVLCSSSNELIREFYSVSQSKSGSFKTASNRHREQLKSLLDRLSSTEPHFVRCIIPNGKKKAHEFDKKLILDQLRCNGVLEGIRIAREGYPNRIFFKEFFQRYRILSDEYRFSNNSKKNCELLLSSLHLDPSLFKVGNTKLFFKAGVLAGLEIKKEERLSEMSTKFNAIILGNHIRQETETQLSKLQAAQVLAVAFETYNRLMDDPWYNLYSKIKPLLASSQGIAKTKKIAEQVKALESKLEGMGKENEILKKCKEKVEEDLKAVRQQLLSETENLENQKQLLSQAKAKEENLLAKLDEASALKESAEKEKVTICELNKAIKDEMQALEKKLEDGQTVMTSLKSEKTDLQHHINKLSKEIADTSNMKDTVEAHKSAMLDQIKSLKSDISKKEIVISELRNKLKASDEELERSLQSLENKFSSTSKRLNSLVEENQDLHSQLDALRTELSESQKTLATKNEEFQEMHQRSEKHQSFVNSLSEERDNLVTEHSKVLDEIKVARKELSDYKRKCSNLEEKCGKLQKTIEDHDKTENFGNASTNDITALEKAKSLEEQLEREKSLTRFLNEKLANHLTERRYVIDFSSNKSLMSQDEIMDAYEELKLNYEEVSFKLEKEITQKKDLISKLRFTETRLASASFDIQTMAAQIKKLKNLVLHPDSNANIEELLNEVEPIEINHEKLILEVEYLKGKLKDERQARLDVENAASALHGKFRQIRKSDSSSGIYKLKYEASEERVKMLESKIHSQPLKDRTNVGNREMFTRRESISKYEEDLRFHKIENYKLQELLVDSEKKRNVLNREIKQFQTNEIALTDQINRLEKDLKSTEKQNELLSASAKSHKTQYEHCINDLHATESQLKNMVHSLKQSEEDIKTMTAIIDRLKTQNRQKDKELWEKETRGNELACQLEEKMIDLKKMHMKNEVLEGELAHFKDRLKFADDNEKYSAQIEDLKKELDNSLRSETELNKEISSLKYNLGTLKADTDAKIEDLLTQNAHYEKVVTALGDERDAASSAQKDLETKLKSLVGKLDSLRDSVDTLVQEKQQLEVQKTHLISKMENSHSDIQKLLNEKDEMSNNLVYLNESLQLQREQNERNEKLVQQLQTTLNAVKTQFSEEKEKNIVLYEENQSLGKSNVQLRDRADLLNVKLSDTTEKDAWLEKVQELESRVNVESEMKFEEMKKNKILERTVEDLTSTNEKQAAIISLANQDRENFTRDMAHYNEQVSTLERHISKQEVDLKRMERDKIYYEDRVDQLEKELELWKEKYSGLSSRRKSLSAQSVEEVFV